VTHVSGVFSVLLNAESLITCLLASHLRTCILNLISSQFSWIDVANMNHANEISLSNGTAFSS